MNTEIQVNIRLGFTLIITLILVILKLANIAHYSWLIALLPILIHLGFVVIVIALWWIVMIIDLVRR